jgi:hypothetical protein
VVAGHFAVGMAYSVSRSETNLKHPARRDDQRANRSESRFSLLQSAVVIVVNEAKGGLTRAVVDLRLQFVAILGAQRHSYSPLCRI